MCSTFCSTLINNLSHQWLSRKRLLQKLSDRDMHIYKKNEDVKRRKRLQDHKIALGECMMSRWLVFDVCDEKKNKDVHVQELRYTSRVGFMC